MCAPYVPLQRLHVSADGRTLFVPGAPELRATGRASVVWMVDTSTCRYLCQCVQNLCGRRPPSQPNAGSVRGYLPARPAWTQMDPELLDRIGALVGRRITACRPALGGYTAAERWICTLEDGRSAFAKVAVDTRTALWLREEHHVYQQVDAVYMPRLLGWSDDHADRPILLLEDLSHADWPPPWTQPRIERVLALISAVAATPAPSDLPRLADQKESVFSGWATVARDPRAFLSLGLCSATWLERSLGRLVQMEADADVSGEALLHLDLRSDNLCFDGPRTVLVDWNLAAIGNPRIELIGWLPSLSVEGGPPPDQLSGPDDASFAVITAGHFAARAGLPPSSPTSRARISQLMQLKPSLPWACRLVGLDPPDPVGP